MLDIIDVLNLYNLKVKICLYGFHVHFFINNVEQSAFFCHHNNPNANIFTHFLGLFSCFLFVGVLGFFFAALATMQDLKFLDQETWVLSLGQEYPLEKVMATHSIFMLE